MLSSEMAECHIYYNLGLLQNFVLYTIYIKIDIIIYYVIK